MLIRLLVCGAMGGARLLEAVHSRRNIASSGPTFEGPWTRRTYPLIVMLHAATIVLTAVRGSSKPAWPFLALLLAVQPLRVWVIRALGSRWNIRAAVPGSMCVETGGPYRYVRHPNYTVVAIELAALPLAFRLPGLAIAASLANAALLSLRIPEEERLLGRLPGYRDHFEHRPRFLPGLF